VNSIWIQKAVREYEARLLRYTRRFVPDAVAREIVQESFLRLCEQSEENIGERLAEWLFTVSRNQAIDWKRAQSKMVSGSPEVMDDSAPPDTRMAANERTSLLLSCLSRLPSEQQEVMRLKFQEELSYKQISAITGHSVSYVGVLLHTAVQELRKKMERKI
jgi:RNA polymerase sigma factor (sigma-70 family)